MLGARRGRERTRRLLHCCRMRHVRNVSLCACREFTTHRGLTTTKHASCISTLLLQSMFRRQLSLYCQVGMYEHPSFPLCLAARVLLLLHNSRITPNHIRLSQIGHTSEVLSVLSLFALKSNDGWAFLQTTAYAIKPEKRRSILIGVFLQDKYGRRRTTIFFVPVIRIHGTKFGWAGGSGRNPQLGPRVPNNMWRAG